MASLNTSHRSNRLSGFSLVEILVVIALAGILLAIGLFMSMDVFRGTTFRETRQVLVSTLTVARARALANAYQQPAGVCYSAPDFVIFRGATYSASNPNNDVVPGNPQVMATSSGPTGFFTCVTGAASGIIFDQVTGRSSTNGTVLIHETGHPDATVSVNSEGTIVW